MRALIIDSDQGRSSLAAARALHRAGWTVGVGGPRLVGLPMLSRSVRHRHLIPRHGMSASSFLKAIDRVIASHAYEVVFGCSDAEVLILSRERHNIGACVPHPPHEVMLRATDKVELADAAEAVGMPTPPIAASAAEARALWGPTPTIVKERIHRPVPSSGALTHIASQAFLDPDSAERRVEEVRALGSVPVVQPLLEGQLIAFTSVVDKRGNMVARVQQAAERTYPRDAGLSVRARTVPIDEQLSDQVGRLLRSLGWFGLSELQFLVPADGVPVLLDFNGRFYGSLALALAAGVNLPDTWARIATSRTPVEAGDARAGVRYQWLEGDLRAARERSQGAVRDAADCLRYGVGAGGSIWSPEDPLPGLLTAGKLLSGTARMVAAGRAMNGSSGTRVTL
jgi:predicted ATP-grasp superfamily ATP-dependent carboligase